MSRELTWWSDMNVELVNTASYSDITRTFLLYIKNNLVAHGNWEVIGSSTGSGTWEYEDVTGGGVYGGDSTGPYDVWESISSIALGEDGSSPGFCVLKGPRWMGSTPYLILAFEGNTTDDMYIAGCGVKPELVSGGVAYLPVVDEEVNEFCEWRRGRWYYLTGLMRTHLSICEDNGSFILLSDRTSTTGINGIVSFMRFDGRKDAPTFTIASGNLNNQIADTIYEYFWKCWSPRPQTWNTDQDPLIADGRSIQWANPVRYGSVDIMDTDLNTVNCFGEVETFPFYLVMVYEFENREQKCGTYGRIPDMFVAPWGLSTGDTLDSGGSPEYYVCGYWVIPGDVAPVVT